MGNRPSIATGVARETRGFEDGCRFSIDSHGGTAIGGSVDLSIDG